MRRRIDKEGSIKAKHFVLLMWTLLVVIVLVENTDIVNFNILIWKVSMSISIFLAVNVLIGIAIGMSIKFISRSNQKENWKSN